MAAQRPIVLVDGVLQQLALGDTLVGGGSSITYTPATVAGGAEAGAAAGSLATTLSGTVSWSVLSGALTVDASTGVLTTTGTAPSNPSGATIAGSVLAKTGGNGVSLDISVPVSAVAAPAVTYLPAIDSTSYAAVYGMHRMVNGFSEPLATVCASGAPDTPTTTVDVPAKADGTPDYTAAVSAFGPVFDLYKQYDQTGANGPAVQATAASRLSITSTRLVNGYSATYTGRASGGWLDLPASISTLRQNTAAIAVLAGSNTGNMLVALGNADGASLSFYGNVSGVGMRAAQQLTPFSAVAIDQNISVFSVRTSGDGVPTVAGGSGRGYSFAAQGAASMAGGALGQYGDYATASGYGFQAGGTMLSRFCDVIFAANPSDADFNAVRAALSSRFNIPVRDSQIVVGGDSISQGVGQGPGPILPGADMWSFLQNGQLTRDPAIYNFGKGFDTALNALGELTADFFAAAFDATRIKNIFFYAYGFNDINSGATAATVDGYDATIIARARAAGFTVVVTSLVANSGEWATLNTLRASKASARGYTFVDLRGTSVNTVDGIHPYSVGGYDNMAATTKPVLNAVLGAASTVTFVDLTLTPATAQAGTSFSASIGGGNPGSTYSATSSDTTLAVSGTTLTGNFGSAGSESVTIVETNSGASHTTTLTVVVSAAATNTPASIFGSSLYASLLASRPDLMTVDGPTQRVTALASAVGSKVFTAPDTSTGPTLQADALGSHPGLVFDASRSSYLTLVDSKDMVGAGGAVAIYVALIAKFSADGGALAAVGQTGVGSNGCISSSGGKFQFVGNTTGQPSTSTESSSVFSSVVFGYPGSADEQLFVNAQPVLEMSDYGASFDNRFGSTANLGVAGFYGTPQSPGSGIVLEAHFITGPVTASQAAAFHGYAVSTYGIA